MPNVEALWTPFSRRLQAVLVAYRTRPLTWVALLAYSAAIAIVVYRMHDPRPPFEDMLEGATREQQFSVQSERMSWESRRQLNVAPRQSAPSPRWNFAPPEVERSFNHGRTIPTEDVRTVAVIDQKHIPAEFWEPGRYPQVETVINYGEPLTHENLRQLLQTYPLKALNLSRAETMTAEDLRLIGQSPALEELSLGYTPGIMDAAAIAWPKTLRTLRMAVHQPLPLARIEEWRALPHLQALILDIPLDYQLKTLTPDVIAALDQLPQRPTLFLGDSRDFDGQAALIAQPLFHSLAVRPQRVPQARLAVAMYAYCLLLIPTAFGIYQLAVQSLQPLLLLAPGAAKPHQAFAAGCWLLGSVISLALAIFYGVHWTAALAVSASGMLCYGLLYALMQRSRGVERVGFIQPVLAGLPLLLTGMLFGIGAAVVHFYPTIGGEFDWFLRGQYPLIGILVGCFGPIAAVFLLRRIVLTQRAAHEVGLGQVPMSAVDLMGWNTVSAPIAGRKLDAALRWNPVMRNRERRIESALNQGPALTRWQRVRVWFCGVHAHPFDMTFMVTLIGLLQVFVFQGLGIKAGEARLDRTVLVAPAIQILVMFLMLPVMSLWIRRRWMPQELLFPLTRKVWTRDWYMMTACMLLPIPVLLGFVAVVDQLLGGIVRPTRTEWIWGGLAIGTAMMASWALSLIVVTWRSSWQLIALGAVFVACLLLPITLAMMSRSWPGLDDRLEAAVKAPSAPIVAAAMAVTTLVALIFWAQQRWKRWEVGRLS